MINHKLTIQKLKFVVIDFINSNLRVTEQQINFEELEQQIRRHRLLLPSEFKPGIRRHSQLQKTDLAWFEHYLKRLENDGQLAQTVLLFGHHSDPLFPFEQNFDSSMQMLKLLLRYPPMRLCFQTRSPLAVIALPVFKTLGERVSLLLALEGRSDCVCRCLTPGLPDPSERLKAAQVFATFGIDLTLQATFLAAVRRSELEAPTFAATLTRITKKINVTPLASLIPPTEHGDLPKDHSLLQLYKIKNSSHQHQRERLFSRAIASELTVDPEALAELARA